MIQYLSVTQRLMRNIINNVANDVKEQDMIPPTIGKQVYYC